MRDIHTWQDVVDFMNQACPVCGEFLNNSPDCEEGCIIMPYVEDPPLFKTSDTGSAVYKLDGEPEYLHFVIHTPSGTNNTYMMPTEAWLEIFKLSNALWYGSLIKQLSICFASPFCQTSNRSEPHIRKETCPTPTEYELRQFDQYQSRVREMRMEKSRPPIPDGTASSDTRSE